MVRPITIDVSRSVTSLSHKLRKLAESQKPPANFVQIAVALKDELSSAQLTKWGYPRQNFEAITISLKAAALTALRRCDECGVSTLFCVSGKAIAGMITRKMCLAQLVASNGSDALSVADFCVHFDYVKTVDIKDSIWTVVETMVDHGVNRVVVVEVDGDQGTKKVVDLITFKDLQRLLLGVLVSGVRKSDSSLES